MLIIAFCVLCWLEYVCLSFTSQWHSSNLRCCHGNLLYLPGLKKLLCLPGCWFHFAQNWCRGVNFCILNPKSTVKFLYDVILTSKWRKSKIFIYHLQKMHMMSLWRHFLSNFSKTSIYLLMRDYHHAKVDLISVKESKVPSRQVENVLNRPGEIGLTLSGPGGGGTQWPGWPNSQLPIWNLLLYDAQACWLLGSILKAHSDQILTKLINQGGCCCSFSLRRLKNFENEKNFLCLKIAEIDMTGQFWVAKNDFRHKTSFFLSLTRSSGVNSRLWWLNPCFNGNFVTSYLQN